MLFLGRDVFREPPDPNARGGRARLEKQRIGE